MSLVLIAHVIKAKSQFCYNLQVKNSCRILKKGYLPELKHVEAFLAKYFPS